MLGAIPEFNVFNEAIAQTRLRPRPLAAYCLAIKQCPSRPLSKAQVASHWRPTDSISHAKSAIVQAPNGTSGLRLHAATADQLAAIEAA